jgi:hypothetical protein
MTLHITKCSVDFLLFLYLDIWYRIDGKQMLLLKLCPILEVLSIFPWLWTKRMIALLSCLCIRSALSQMWSDFAACSWNLTSHIENAWKIERDRYMHIPSNTSLLSGRMVVIFWWQLGSMFWVKHFWDTCRVIFNEEIFVCLICTYFLKDKFKL